jgi:uncharacterized protein
VRHAIFRFYGELNDFLPAHLRQRTVRRECEGPASVKDLIESCGVPHTEVDLVLINGDPADFARQVADGDRVAVYPRFRSVEPAPEVRLQPPPLATPRFVLDIHLGRLAGYLRLAGFDAAYRNDFSDEELARVSHHEDRTLLTRDRELLKRSIVTRGYFVRETIPRRQLAEIIRHFDLDRRVAPLTRCARCNAALVSVPKEDVADELPPYVRANRREFLRCSGCRRVYWEGTHVNQIRRFLRLVLQEPPPA